MPPAEEPISQARLQWNLAGTLFLKFASLAIGVLILPSYFRYFDDSEALGIWFTVLAITSWVLFFDFGLGNGLKNRLIADFASRRFADAVSSIATTYAGMLACGFAIYLAVLFAMWVAGGPGTVATALVKSTDPDVLAGLVVIAIALFLQFQLRLVSAVLLAQQRSALVALLPCATQVLIWSYLAFAYAQGHSGSFLNLAYAYSAAILLPLLLATLAAYRDVRRWGVPFSGSVDPGKLGQLASSGGRFFWIQLCLLGINGSNELLILQLVESAEVATYQVYFRLFSVVVFGVAAVTVPVWSAMGQAQAVGDRGRMRQLFRFLGVVVMIAVLASVLLGVGADRVIEFWMGEGVVEVSSAARQLFAVYTVLMAVILCGGCVGNAFDSLTAQLWSLSLALLLKVVLLLFAIRVESWIDVMLATTLCLVPAAVWLVLESVRVASKALARPDATPG